MVEIFINKQNLINSINNCKPFKLNIDELSYIDGIIRQYTDAFIINETTIDLHCTQEQCNNIVHQIRDYLQREIKVEMINHTSTHFKIKL